MTVNLSARQFGDPDLIAPAIHGSIGLRQLSDMSVGSSLTAQLGPRQLLLVLENLERLQDGGLLVSRLLEECPRLRMLLTSPLGLELDGEQTVEVGLVEQQAADEPAESGPPPATWRVLQHADGGRPIVRRVSGWCLQPGVPPDPSRLAPLTNREQQVAQLLALGFSNKEIADELVITYRTAETHACRILRKLGFSCRGHVVQWAIERGLVVVASRQS